MIVLFAEPLSHFRHFFRFALSMRPSAALPMGRHSTSPLATISLSFPPLDGEDHPVTEIIPEITLEDRQAQRCCQHRNSLFSSLDADARVSREKTLRRERRAPVRSRLAALQCPPNPPKPRLSSSRFRWIATGSATPMLTSCSDLTHNL